MSIKRNPSSEKVTRYFGTTEWRDIWNSSSPQEVRDLIDLYKRRLAEIGFIHLSDLDERIETRRGQRLYYLIHVSKVLPAGKIMAWVKKQPKDDGQLRLPEAPG